MKHGIIAAAFISIAASAPCFGQESGFPSGVLSAPGGRYVFGQISPFARHQYMLDTQTGRLWQVVCSKRSEDGKECILTTLSWVPYGIPGEDGISVFPDQSAPKVKKPAM